MSTDTSDRQEGVAAVDRAFAILGALAAIARVRG